MTPDERAALHMMVKLWTGDAAYGIPLSVAQKAVPQLLDALEASEARAQAAEERIGAAVYVASLYADAESPVLRNVVTRILDVLEHGPAIEDTAETERLVAVGMEEVQNVLDDLQVHGAVSDWAADEWQQRAKAAEQQAAALRLSCEALLEEWREQRRCDELAGGRFNEGSAFAFELAADLLQQALNGTLTDEDLEHSDRLALRAVVAPEEGA